MLLKCILLLALAATCVLATKVKNEFNSRSKRRSSPAKSYPNGSGKAVTTRYWDCCKPSCAWKANVGDVTGVVKSCAAGGSRVVGTEVQSGCNGGSSFACNSQQPFVSGGQAYAFAAANVNGLPMQKLCCSCYKLTFTSKQVRGQSMIVQVINTGSDLGNNHFDLQLPASGVGIFKDGCTKEWPQTPRQKWGNDYGGISSRPECLSIPKQLQQGCFIRFDWFKNADNPSANFVRVPCPAALTSKSGCKRNDD